MVTTRPLLNVSILSSKFNLKTKGTTQNLPQPINKNFY